MWEIFEHSSLIKSIAKLPAEVIKHYELWKRVVEHEGPQGLYLVKGFHDEALKGDWKGCRSSRLNRKWRVIYKIEKQDFEVYVIEVNPHDY